MEAILPYNSQDSEHFVDKAIEIGFHEFVALKYIYVMQESDLDMFPLMGRERLEMLLYGWEVCQIHWEGLPNKNTIPESMQIVLKRLAQHSLDIWFSKEWDQCQSLLCAMLMVCIKRARDLLVKLPEYKLFDWDYVLALNIDPWSVSYLKRFVDAKENPNKTLTQSSEHVEEPATQEDIAHVEKEGLVLLLLRLIKLFDGGAMEGVRCLAMRIIAAWNHQYEQSRRAKGSAFLPVKEEHKQCLVFICHMYLMATYEMDDVRGFVIDNMINNIRFYYKSMQENTSADKRSIDLQEYTAARYIAITCVNLRITNNDFFDAFIFDTYDESFVSLFGVVSQSYMSYLLGNLLMEMNNLNEEDFLLVIDDYKRFINLYIIERERSEMFMLKELHKKELQNNSHSMTATVQNMTDLKSKMCKGNRMSNIGSCDHMDADEKKLILQEESEKRIDPVFQSMPSHEHVLSYVFGVLAKRNYKGWHYAKLILLLKIIGMELNAIETWRYHPGLTTDFMLNLELKLSRRFEALAQIFNEHPFMEQEFWLTAFYLNPSNKLYHTVVRTGMRFNRLSRLNAADDEEEKPAVNLINAKFGLLSSTIDVQAIVHMANHETPEVDYEPLYEALRSFKLPDHVIKDLLTVTFLPRNKSFAWAVNWAELRKRCKNLVINADQKRRLVELNMAEANDRLKYLKIDYEKYKHRPQLDYGSIEQGYEGVHLIPFENNESDLDDEDEDDFEADSDLDMPHKEEPKKDDHAELFDTYFMSTRRTRARAAAVIATALTKGESTLSKEKAEESKEEATLVKEDVAVAKKDDTAEIPDNPTTSTTENKRDLTECLKERNVFNNGTSGFNPFPDIWNLDAKELQTVESNCMAHLETGDIFQKFKKLKTLKTIVESKQIEKDRVEEELLKAKKQSTETSVDLTEAICAKVTTHSTPVKKSAATEKDAKATDYEMDDENYDSDVSTVAQRDSEEASETFNESYECAENQAKGQDLLPIQDSREKLTHADNTTLEKDITIAQISPKKAALKIYTSDKKVNERTPETITTPIKKFKAAKPETKTTPDRKLKGISSNITPTKSTAMEQSDTDVEMNAAEMSSPSSKSVKNDELTRKISSESNETAQTSESEHTAKLEDLTSHVVKPHTDVVNEERVSAEQEALFKLCAEKELQVTLHRLTVADISQLRQPRVRLERLNIETLPGRLMKRRIKPKVFFDSDGTSRSSSGSVYGERTLKNMFKDRLYSSESSTESEEYRHRRPMGGRALRGRGTHVGYSSGSSSGPSKRGRPKKMMVTPRSASGLKMRISSMSPGDAPVASTSSSAIVKCLPIVDYIQITSSSSSEAEVATDEQCSSLSTVKEEEEVVTSDMMVDPLYEEEIIPIFRTKYSREH